MAIYPISPSTQSGNTNTIKGSMDKLKTNANESAKYTMQTVPDTEAVVFEKSGQNVKNTRLTYTKNSAALSEISRQVEDKFAGLSNMVENLFSMQSVRKGESNGLSYDQISAKYDGNLKSFFQNLEVDESTSLKAQQEISQDGFWGVKQVSQRAIQFAISLSGGDPSKLATLKNAILKGYEAAEKSWGGELPSICKQTKEATLKGLDDWAEGA